MQQNRNVLSAIGLGLNAPAWGWPAGIGLRWMLPVATTVRGPGVSLQNQPRGWPTKGEFRIYRTTARQAVKSACAGLAMSSPGGAGGSAWNPPIALGQTNVTVDWAARGQSQNLADALAASGGCLLSCHQANWGLSLALSGFQPTRDLVPAVAYRAYDNGGRLIAKGRATVRSQRVVTIVGPNIRLVELEFTGIVRLIQVCLLTVPGDPMGAPIHVVRPITDVATILSTIPPNRVSGVDWNDFANRLTAAIANVDARLPETVTGSAGIGASGMPIVDLLLLLSIDPVIASLMGLLWWDNTAVASTGYVYWIAGTWQGLDYAWPVGPLFPQPPAPFSLSPDINLNAWALPPSVGVDANGSFGQPATAAAVNWAIASASDPLAADNPDPQTAPLPFAYGPPLNAVVPVRYRLGRKSIPFGTPSASVDAQVADLSTYTVVPGGDVVPTSTTLPYRVFDAGFAEGKVAWSLTGYDLFARPSNTITVGPIDIWDSLRPPPPSGVRAAWLDRKVLGASPAFLRDPAVTAEHEAFLRNNPGVASAIYLGFEWPPASAQVAPTVREFRLYARRADSVTRMRTLIGSVNAVAGHPEWSDCVVSDALPSSRDDLVGGTLSDGRASFVIVEVAAPSEAVNRIRVANVRQAGRIAVTPNSALPSTNVLTPSSDPPNYRTPTAAGEALVVANLAQGRYWPERLAIVAKVAPLSTTILAVTSDVTSGDVRQVGIDLTAAIAHPAPSQWIYAEGGYLQIGEAAFAASLVANDASRTLPTDRTRLVVRLPASDTTTFSPGQSVTYYAGLGCYRPHASYRGAGELRTSVLVTASAANDSHAPDAVDDVVHGSDPQWQEAGQARHGYESDTAPYPIILDVERAPPPPPDPPEAPDFASWPNAAGMATFSLPWTPQAGTKYVVMRAVDETLFFHDRKLRASAGTNYGTDEVGESGSLATLTSPATYPDADHPGSPDYQAVFAADPGLLRRIASLPGNAPAFTARMPKPLGADDCLSATPPRTFASLAGAEILTEPGMWYDTRTSKLVFTDPVQGIGTNLYFYRVLAVDGVGNGSSLGKSTPPVVLRVKVAPRTPVLDRVRFGDSAITLLWNVPADGSVDRYLVYSAATADALTSLDLLQPDVVDRPTIFTIDSSDGVADDASVTLPPNVTPPGYLRWGWFKREIPPQDLYVAVVAEKDMPSGASLRSPPTRPLRIKPKEYSVPSPPELVSLTRGGTSATVQFDLDMPWHSVAIDQRTGSARTWTSVLPFTVPASLPMSFSFTVDATARCSVRLRARNGEGVLSAPAIGTLP